VGITKPNFVKISQMAAEVLGFNGVQNGGRPPSWILKFKILNGHRSEFTDLTSACQIS